MTNLGPKDPKQDEGEELTRDQDFGGDDPPDLPELPGDDDDDGDGDALPEIPRGDEAPDTSVLPQTPATLAIARMSERLLSRTVGMNAYQKGRGYARRGHVLESSIDGWAAVGRVHGRAAEPYVVRVDVSELGTFTSTCTCPAWRGPERHCKHVAALLVALRDRMKPLREAAMQQAAQVAQAQQHSREEVDRRKVKGRRPHRSEAEHPREVVVLDRGGSRLVGASAPAISSIPQAPGTVVSGESRMNWQVWLPPSDPRRAPEFEYRLQLRPMAIAVTAFNAEARTAMTPDAALEALGPSMSPHRNILRVLSRNARGARQAAVELRGEDAAELLTLLRGRRVLIEPTLMELRFVDDPLIPKMELESAGAASVRAKVVFERKSDGRKYGGGQGLWFEGTPTWHVDTVQGIARTVADSVTPAWLERLSRAPMILHPVEDLGRLLGEIVPKVALALGTELPDLSTVATLVDITPTFMLRAEGDLSKVRATLRACYGDVELDVPPADLPPPLAIVPPSKAARDDDGSWDKPRVIRRDIGAERMAADRLFELGLGLPEEHSGWFEASGDKAVSFWMEGVGSLPDDWDRFIPDDLMHVQVRDTPITPRARVGSGVDWLSLDVEFVSEGSKVNEDDLRRALLEGRRLVRLEDGTFAPVSREQVDEVLLRMAEIFAQGRQHIPLSQAGRVQDLLRLLPGARVEPAAKDLLARLADHGMVEQIAQPKSLHATMRPYQGEGFSWLVFLHRAKTGGVLADDMGLGKTLQTLSLLAWQKEEHQRALDAAAALLAPAVVEETAKPAKGKKVAAKKKAPEPEPEPAKALKPKKGAKKAAEEPAAAAAAPAVTVVKEVPKRPPLTLVVAPTSVVTNWLREISRFAPSLRAVAWTGPDREKRLHELDHADVVITSYALLRRDEEFLQRYEFAYAILDEAQNIKNPLSATARAAKRLRSQRRLALTGTPIENRLSEIWSIFDFLSPGMLGDLATFEERYARPIDRGDAEAIRRLRGVIRPLVLRRTKSEVAKDLPARIVVEREVDLPVPQRALYQQVLAQVRDNVFGEIDRVGIGKSQIMILAGLTRLRQAACDPRLLKVPGDFKDEDAGKLDALREIIQEAIQSGHRTLVFSQFVEMLSLIRKALERDGVAYEYLDGSTKDRQDKVDHFNRNEAVPVFLISLKAGGSGLNLTGADTVVHFDPWWNPAVEDQATDRAHRIGQTRVVTAYRLIARQTIEEKIMQLGAKKRELVSSVLGAEDNVSLKGLTRADVEMLFSEEGPTGE